MEWISVADRLPKEQKVLFVVVDVARNDSFVLLGVYGKKKADLHIGSCWNDDFKIKTVEGFSWGGGDNDANFPKEKDFYGTFAYGGDDDDVLKVIHWMPLPEPPEPERVDLLA